MYLDCNICDIHKIETQASKSYQHMIITFSIDECISSSTKNDAFRKVLLVFKFIVLYVY